MRMKRYLRRGGQVDPLSLTDLHLPDRPARHATVHRISTRVVITSSHGETPHREPQIVRGSTQTQPIRPVIPSRVILAPLVSIGRVEHLSKRISTRPVRSFVVKRIRRPAHRRPSGQCAGTPIPSIGLARAPAVPRIPRRQVPTQRRRIVARKVDDGSLLDDPRLDLPTSDDLRGFRFEGRRTGHETRSRTDPRSSGQHARPRRIDVEVPVPSSMRAQRLDQFRMGETRGRLMPGHGGPEPQIEVGRSRRSTGRTHSVEPRSERSSRRVQLFTRRHLVPLSTLPLTGRDIGDRNDVGRPERQLIRRDTPTIVKRILPVPPHQPVPRQIDALLPFIHPPVCPMSTQRADSVHARSDIAGKFPAG